MTRRDGQAPGEAWKREAAECVLVWAAVAYGMAANEMASDVAASFPS